MSKLIYITNTSLDGYIEDETGAVDWSNPDQVFSFITDLLRPITRHLYGRRLYETMAYWDAPVFEGNPPEHREFAQIWQNAQKIVFSRTLTEAGPNARIVHDFDAEAIRKLKASSKSDLLIGGAELAALALEAGLVDECHLFLHPIVLGGGKAAFRPGWRRNLELLETRKFETGAVYLQYRARSAQ